MSSYGMSDHDTIKALQKALVDVLRDAESVYVNHLKRPPYEGSKPYTGCPWASHGQAVSLLGSMGVDIPPVGRW